jgi:CRISPR-associated Csx2 family protein
MARKVFISFLGTNDYLECHYKINEKESNATRFVQEALIDYYCSEWIENDEIIIFGTAGKMGSKTKNWLDNGQTAPSLGLQSILQSKKLKVKVNEITIIPEGFSEKEIWNIFEIVFDKLRNGDEIYLDVTHAFRSIPLFSTILFNYAQLLIQTKLVSIHYGAFEKLGPASEVKKMPIEQRIAPVLDLMPLVNLQDWTTAASNFINYGKTDKIHCLLEEKYRPMLATDNDARNLRNLDDRLKKHSESIISNKLDKIIKGVDIQSALKSVKDSPRIITHAFNPLLEKIEEKLQTFCQNDLKNVFAATDWCIQHELYQNAYSILLEGTISIILNKIGEEYAGQTKAIEHKRNIITYVADYKSQNKTKEQTISDCRYTEVLPVLEKTWNFIGDDLKIIIVALNAKRNSYMHAGTGTNPLGNFETLKDDITEFNKKLKNHFNHFNQSSDKC